MAAVSVKRSITALGCRKTSRFVSVSQINNLPQPSAAANNRSDLPPTDKSRNSAQPRPIIVNNTPGAV